MPFVAWAVLLFQLAVVAHAFGQHAVSVRTRSLSAAHHIISRTPLCFFPSGFWTQRRHPPFLIRRDICNYNVDDDTFRTDEDTSTIPEKRSSFTRRSCIIKIRSKNLAGAVSVPTTDQANEEGSDDVVISLEKDKSQLVSVTGESGHGKSLLFFRVMELLTGGKASPTYLTAPHETAMVEIEILLCGEPIVSAAKEAFSKAGLDYSTLFDDELPEEEKSGKLVLTRQLNFQSSLNNKTRMKSTCQINGQTVTVKTLSSFASPLLTLVDAATAATALSKPEARLAVLDTAVPSEILNRVAQARTAYRRARQEREKLEDELAARTLPVSFTALKDDDEGDLEMVSHWIDELDAFEERVSDFCKNVASGSHDEGSESLDLGQKLAATTWDHRSKSGGTYSSTMFALLSEFRDKLQSLDQQYAAATNALESLAALSSPNSAVTAVEKARNFLFDASPPDAGSRVSLAAERSHEMLNEVESALNACQRFMEDSDQGLLRSLETTRAAYPVSVESIDEILLDWKALARKHGIHPSTLPSCHRALENERSGNVEARSLLPIAIEEEAEGMVGFEIACSILSQHRQAVAANISLAVSGRLSSLGMDGAVFRVDLRNNTRACSDASVYSSSATLGVDSADYVLLNTGAGTQRQGKVDLIASSGEKARILLAIECGLPGSVGASCSSANSISTEYWSGIPPIAVVYDEIDSHVGGRAAVAMSRMLRDQSESSQVIAITHSPSVAAVADTHIVIQKVAPQSQEPLAEGATPVRVSVVSDAERRKELARMASGDLAIEEAEIFADALIREGRRKVDA